MRQFKPGQLQTGSLYDITSSFALTASYTLGLDTGSLLTTASFNAFTASYTTGSFTGSFRGDGSQLTGIVSSKWTGSNPISRQSDVEITGSLRVQGSITGSLFGTASWSNNSTSASLANNVNIIGTSTNIPYNIVFSQQVNGSTILRADTNAHFIYNPSTNLLVLGANSGPGQLQVTGSIIATDGISGSLFGTASWAQNAQTASYVLPLNQDVLINGSLNVTSSFTASGLIYPPADNGEESFIQTDGNGNLSLQYVKTIYEEIVNGESTQLVKGTPVYVSGSQGAASVVYQADAADPAKMPVIYIVADTLSAGESGRGIALGLIKGVNTTGYPAGTEIYIAAGGGWTLTRPTGSAIVQVLGYVTKEGSGGQGVVLNPGPSNLPNIAPGNVWVGGINSYPTTTPTSSLSVASSSFAINAQTASFAPNYTLTQSFDAFTASYNTGSFTGSYTGDGGGLYNIPATGIVGLNLSQIASGSVSASISPQSGLQVNTNVTAPSFTGSLFGTASWAQNAVTASYVETAQTASYVLNAVSASFATSASFAVSASRAVSASFASTASFVTPLNQNVLITGSINITQNITGSRMFLSASSNMNSGSTLTVYGSGSTQPVFTVQGSQGELFSVTDSLSGSLFSVNDISGLPILEVFSDNTTLIGNYLDPMLITTAKVTQTNSGSFVLYSLPTASYDTAFFEYSVRSGSNARAGTIIAIQSGSAVNFTETTTTDFGSTSAISFVVVVTGSAMALTGSSTTGSWTIKTIVRGL